MEETDRPAHGEDSDRSQDAPMPEGETAASISDTAHQAPNADQTQEVPATSPPPSPEEQDRRLAATLTQRGVPPEEVQRLLALGRGATSSPAVAKKASPGLASPPPIPPSAPYVPKPTITLPPFREATPQERMRADSLLTAANVARRRGNFKEAEQRCREAIELTPQDAAALELYGDIFQSVGRVDDALFAYERAKEADPNRASAEKKYAELMLLQNREIERLREEFIPRNANVAVLFSALMPGAGQVYNGEPLKGFLIFLTMVVCLLVLGWTGLGFPGSEGRISASLVFFVALAALTYIYAVVDANIIARRGKRPKTGWEV